MKNNLDTIVAQATPHGKGGISIIRISGSLSKDIAKIILGTIPESHKVNFCKILTGKGEIIDSGLAILFNSPKSFTGEDILELQIHGNPILVNLVLQRICELGARLAYPGEFTQRAFLNRKLDLLQAEAIADLINATTEQSVFNANRSLQGKFSFFIQKLSKLMLDLRTKIEAEINFIEDDISEILASINIKNDISEIIKQIKILKAYTQNGILLHNGMNVILAGDTNVGKSSIFNYLINENRAIVTDIPGTTRDILHYQIQLDGIPLNLFDTAGIRESTDIIEIEGINRAWERIGLADQILLIVDISRKFDTSKIIDDILNKFPYKHRITIIYNKIDLIEKNIRFEQTYNEIDCIYLSAKYGIGMDLLKKHILSKIGFHVIEDGFSARPRHLEAILEIESRLLYIRDKLLSSETIDIIAEQLKLTQIILDGITGKITNDDILENIFSQFCIGK